MFSFVFEFLISDNEKELQLNIYNKTKRDAAYFFTTSFPNFMRDLMAVGAV